MYSLIPGVPQKNDPLFKVRSREKELYKKATYRLYDKDQRLLGDDVINLFS